MSTTFCRSTLAACVTAGLAVASVPAFANPAKNVFMMISDGASWGAWDMASYWEHGQLGKQPYDSFDVKLGLTTHSASTNPPDYTYDWTQAWDTTPTGDGDFFAGYNYIKQNFSDSAAAGTALATGVRTTNGRIGMDAAGNPLPLLTHKMTALGKSTGVVSSVPWTHATPAAFGAQNPSRSNYGEIARQMIDDDSIHLDVIMGAGNPLYNSDGQLRAAGTERFANETGRGGGFISESVWNDLNSGHKGWTLIQDKNDFEALADGTLQLDRVVGTPKTGDTLQYNRSDTHGTDASNPTGLAYNPDVPSLATMTRGAINVLNQNDNGFFLMVEGGAVDWAAHANNTERLIEEQVDFNGSILEVVNWVDANGGWEENLVIVLTDHGNGMPMGPNSDTIAFERIQNNGAGVVPGVLWHYGTHTTENTLMWAMGNGADLLFNFVDDYDFGLRYLNHNADGAYIDIIDVFPAVQAAVVPVPASVLLLGSTLVPLVSRMRRKAA